MTFRSRRLLLAAAVLLATGCDAWRIPFFWRTYEHPTLRFSLKVPRNWEVQQDAFMGTAVILRAPESEPGFRANATVVVEPKRSPVTLDELADRSAKQLVLVFDRYQLLARANTTLGELRAVEIRGRYYSREGPRIVRSVIALTGDTQYVVTFTAAENREPAFTATFDGIRRSFSPPRT